MGWRRKRVRHLDNEFMEDLKQGRLRGLLDMVISDSSLCLELRGRAVHVYYRGGLLIEVERKRDSYSLNFDGNYFKGSKGVDLPEPHDSGAWLELAPRLKNAIDRHPSSKDEREFQQVLLRGEQLRQDSEVYRLLHLRHRIRGQWPRAI